MALAATAPAEPAAKGRGNHPPEVVAPVVSDDPARGLRGFGATYGILNPSALVLHWREMRPDRETSERSAEDTLLGQSPADVGHRTRPGWLLPAIGATIGATAFTYSYVEGCRRADCVGFAVPYTLAFGATVGGAVGLGAELLLRMMHAKGPGNPSPRPLNPES